jgi:hypothetical protein
MDAESTAATEAPLHCARHPSVETYLRCGRCETPICPKCQVMTPVGSRCPNCARVRRTLGHVDRGVLVRASLVSLVVGLVGGALLLVVPLLRGLFLSLLLGGLLGTAMAWLVLRSTNQRAGPTVAWVAIGCLALGVIAVRLGAAALVLAGSPGVLRIARAASALQPLETALLLIVAGLVAYNRLR